MIGSKFSRHSFNQSEVKPKPIMARTCTFSRSLCRLHLITSSFDWFTGLSPSFLIGQSNYFENRSRTTSAGNNSRSSDIVRPNFENVRPISHYDRTRWPNMSPAHLEFSSSKCCQSIYYVWSNLSNVRPKGRFERTYVLWINKNYFQHWQLLLLLSSANQFFSNSVAWNWPNWGFRYFT